MGMMSHWWGPVFDAERTTRARRWQGYALRSLFVLGLLVGLVLVGISQSRRTGLISVQQMAEAGASAYRILVILQLTVVLAVAPAATAGAICLDKTRGMLAHVFVTDLTDREIILGKLAARLLPVLGLLACALPVAALATWLGGIDPVALTGAFIVVGGLAVLGCSFALMLSVWASKPHEVLTVVFSAWAIWLLAWPVSDILLPGPRAPAWFERTNPFFLAFAPYTRPGETSLVEPIVFGSVCGLIGAVCTAVAVAKVRVVGCRSTRIAASKVGWVRRAFPTVANLGRRRGRWGRGPALDANPVLWREWHRNRPSRWSKVVWGGFGGISAVVGVYLLLSLEFVQRSALDQEIPGVLLGALVTLGLLLVSAGTASVLAEERAQGSLDVLMSTPVSTRAILWAKWRGAFRRVPWLAAWPVVVGVAYALAAGFEPRKLAIVLLVPILIMVQGAALVSLGLALATWIKRTGQATAWTVAALVVSVVGWPIIGINLPLGDLTALRSTDGSWRMIAEFGLAMGCPFFNVGLSLVAALADRGGNYDGDREGVMTLLIAWTLIYGGEAILLFELTVRTFDRCLGRAPERPTTPRLEPVTGSRPRRSKLGGRDRGALSGVSRPVARAASRESSPR